MWTAPVEQYKLKLPRSSGSSGSGDGALGCFLALVELGIFLSRIERELVVTHTLYARCAEGEDKELMRLLSAEEAGFVQQTLQGLLEARSPAGETQAGAGRDAGIAASKA